MITLSVEAGHPSPPTRARASSVLVHSRIYRIYWRSVSSLRHGIIVPAMERATPVHQIDQLNGGASDSRLSGPLDDEQYGQDVLGRPQQAARHGQVAG